MRRLTIKAAQAELDELVELTLAGESFEIVDGDRVLAYLKPPLQTQAQDREQTR